MRHVHGHKEAFGVGQGIVDGQGEVVVLIALIDLGDLIYELGVDVVFYAVAGHQGDGGGGQRQNQDEGQGEGQA